SLAGTKPDAGWALVHCQSYETEVHRTRSFTANERKRPARKTGPVSDERKRSATAAALSGLRQRRTRRRSHQRHGLAELELGGRHGVCLEPAREDRCDDRHRDSRAEISRYDREKTALQKIMNVPDDLLYAESHEWIKREGDKVRVGITDHAQSELTDVV